MSVIDFESLGNGRFLISGELGFESAEYALEESERLFEPFQDLDLDLGPITSADSAGLAVLIEWMSRARQDHKDIRFRNLPAQLYSLAQISEVEGLLPLAEKAA